MDVLRGHDKKRKYSLGVEVEVEVMSVKRGTNKLPGSPVRLTVQYCTFPREIADPCFSLMKSAFRDFHMHDFTRKHQNLPIS